MIAEVIKAHEADSKKPIKTKGKKGKKGRPKEVGREETSGILKELKNALRPVSVEKRGEEGSRPSTPMRSAHDQLMESIRSSSIRTLKRVSGRICATTSSFKLRFFFPPFSLLLSVLQVALSPFYSSGRLKYFIMYSANKKVRIPPPQALKQ